MAFEKSLIVTNKTPGIYYKRKKLPISSYTRKPNSTEGLLDSNLKQKPSEIGTSPLAVA